MKKIIGIVVFFLLCFSFVLKAEQLQFSTTERKIINSLSSQAYSDKKNSPLSGNKTAIALGSSLFFSRQLSGDNKISCASCHNPLEGWANHQAITSLRPAYPATRHVPSLWGVKYNRWYFWDGRADSLWSQALQPIENIAEMAGNRTKVAYLIVDSPNFRHDYEALFGKLPTSLLNANLTVNARPVASNPQHPEHRAWRRFSPKIREEINHLFSRVGKVIATFEETLVSHNSPFDRFAIQLAQDPNPSKKSALLSIKAQRGLKLFIGKAGCVNCHFGANFSDGEFHHSFLTSIQQDLGRYGGVKALLKDPFNSKSPFHEETNTSKKLNYVYQNISFRGQFKTPSLRNIAQSYPYMHTGEFKNLYEVLTYYNTISERINAKQHQEVLLTSLQLSQQEMNELVEFLKSLSEIKP